ncbi:MAG: hypothetical protein ACMZ63_09190 [Methylotenera sp.]
MKAIINLGLIISLLTACGAEIAYKRGATGRDFQSEKAACQKATTEQALNQCLEENGWAIQKLDGATFSDDELFATASVTDDNRITAPKEKTKSLQTTEKLEDEVAKQDETKAKEKMAPTIGIDSSEKTETASNTASAHNEKTAANAITAKPQKSIFDTYVIKSWWKMGGNANLLERNMMECNEQLGDAHTPDKKTFTFTRGFAICMRQKGWRGLIEK